MKNENIFKFDDTEISSVSKRPVSGKSGSSGGRHYAKKKHRRKTIFSRMGRGISGWWGRRRKWQRVTMVTVTSIVLVAAIAFGAFRIIFDYNYNNITKNPEDLGFENVIDSKIINVALFGIDTRKLDSFKGLSDSIMIMSLNTETKKVKIISVMRDSLVPITYNGKTTYTKINAAYSKGGPELAIKTLNTIFKLDISEYATVNFYGMSEIIDAVGGIDVNLSEGELDYIGHENGRKVNWGLNGLIDEQCGYMNVDPEKHYIKTGGVHHLNGIQAVAYARIRHAPNADGTNDDYGRTDRQRYVMEQLFNKAVTLQKSQYVKLAKALIPCSETSLSYSEIMGLAFDVLLHSPAFEQTRVPLRDYQMSNSSYVYYDLDYASKIIHAFIYDNIKPEDYITTNGVEKNDWYANRYSTGSKSGSKSGTSSSGSKSTVSSNGSKSNTTSSTDKITNGSGKDSITTSDGKESSSESVTDKDTQQGSGDGNNDTTGNSSGTSSETSSSGSTGGDKTDGNTGTTESGSGSQGSQSSNAPSTSTPPVTNESGSSTNSVIAG